jgi:hypothetical protein
MTSHKPDYLPNTGEEHRRWLENFIEKLSPLAGLLGIAPADIEKLRTRAADLVRIEDNLSLFKQTHMAYSAVEKLFVEGLEDVEVALPVLVSPPAGGTLKGGIQHLVSRLTDTLKNSPAYTDAIGAELGVLSQQVAPSDAVQIGPWRFKDKVLLLMWRRGHPFTAIEVFVDNGNGRGFVSKGRDHHPPVAIWDKLPHEGGLVRIQAQGYVNDKPVGGLSPVLEIQVPPHCMRS